MNDIQIFSNPEFGEVRTVEENGTVKEPNGSISIKKTPLVTGKGQQYFINLFLGQ